MENCIFLSKKEIDKILAAKPVQGKRMLMAIAEGRPFGILEDTEVSNEAEVHKLEGDLWHCLEGEVEFVCGGELVDSWVRESSGGNELGGKDIKGGTSMVLKNGDWLWIPAGEPHMHKTSGTARLVIIKIPKK